ncbi:MAG: hypothetical protein AAF502_14765 [Bacteroidota bacterium]
MKKLLIPLFCLFAAATFAQLPKLDKPLQIEKVPQNIPQDLRILQPDLVVENFTINRAAPYGNISGEAYYRATFSAVIKNIGDMDATTFHVAFFVDDYSHPVSGDSWWYRQTQRNEQINLKDVPNNLRVNGYLPLLGGRDKNTVVVSKLEKNGSITIRGTLIIKKLFVDHYHITVAVDCKKGATKYLSNEGSINESDERNNTKKVMPRD